MLSLIFYDNLANVSTSRIKNSAKNVIFGCLGYLIGLIMAFVSKSIFLKHLGEHYNGLNGLFVNILNVLNIAELGFGSAVVFSIYEPLKNNDEIKISKIVNFMGTVYLIISLTILFFGLILLPFVQYLIKNPIDEMDYSLKQLRIYYFLFLLNSVLGYALVHKKTLIIADQKSYLATNVDNGTTILLHVLQITILVLMKNQLKFHMFIVFLVLQIVKTILRNIIIYVIASKKYKYLKKYRKLKLDKSTKTVIFKKVRDMSIHKVSEAILSGSTTIIISAFIGISETSTYSNYMLIIINLIVVINIFYSALLASIGNLCVSTTSYKQLDIFNKINYITKFLSFCIFVCVFLLINDFMIIWLKNNELHTTFNIETVFAICFFAYLTIYRKTTISFRDAKGLFTQDRYKAIFEILIGLPLSILFSLEFGVIGAIASYCFTMLVISIPTETKILFRFGFRTNLKKYYFDSIMNLLLTFFIAIGLSRIFSFIPLVGWKGFVLKFILAVVSSISIFILFTFYTDEFKYYINLFKKSVKKLSLKNKRTQ